MSDLEPVFIHSSFRTGSTWLWSKFRENKNTYCYYEVFNEILHDIDVETIKMSSATWNSHHPAGPPYFNEYSPLLKGSGISGFDRDMAVADFFLKASGDLDRVTKTRDYLLSMVNLAQNNGLVPILSCTRSIGRIAIIREAIGGSHILLKRNIFNQWLSYSNQALNGNYFFLQQMILSISAGSDDLFVLLRSEYLDKCIDFNNPSDQDYDNLLIAFLCLHLYLYAKHENDFDLVLDFGAVQSCSSLDLATAQIERLTSLEIDISDYREVISAPQKLVCDIDRVISSVESLFLRGVSEEDWDVIGVFVKNELNLFKKNFVNYKEIAGSAHFHLEFMKNKYKEQKIRCDEKNNILEKANQQNIFLNSCLDKEALKSEYLYNGLKEVKSSLENERNRIQNTVNESFEYFNEIIERLQARNELEPDSEVPQA